MRSRRRATSLQGDLGAVRTTTGQTDSREIRPFGRYALLSYCTHKTPAGANRGTVCVYDPRLAHTPTPAATLCRRNRLVVVARPESSSQLFAILWTPTMTTRTRCSGRTPSTRYLLTCRGVTGAALLRNKLCPRLEINHLRTRQYTATMGLAPSTVSLRTPTPGRAGVGRLISTNPPQAAVGVLAGGRSGPRRGAGAGATWPGRNAG